MRSEQRMEREPREPREPRQGVNLAPRARPVSRALPVNPVPRSWLRR